MILDIHNDKIQSSEHMIDCKINFIGNAIQGCSTCSMFYFQS
jgi:hypothetical protein